MRLVSAKAVVSRINRAYRRDEEPLVVRVCREDSRVFRDFGRYYTHDVSRNLVLHTNIDLEQFARECGVLRDDERVEDEE